MLINFSDLFIQLKNAVVELAKGTFKDMAAAAASDGTSLLHIIQSDLENYTQQLADGLIDEDEFRLLLSGDEDLVEMTALTEAGLAAAQADAFKTSVINTIIDTVFKFI